MGRTLLGVDLDESPVGGLVERLLTDEELEKLADGGRPGDRRDDGGRGGETPAGSGAVDDGGDADTGGADSGGDADTGGVDEESGPDDGPDAPGETREGTRRWDGAGGFERGGGDTADGADGGGLRERLATLRPLVLKAAVALAVLAVLAAVVWRYLGRVTDALPSSVPTPGWLRGGGESGDAGTDDAVTDDAGISPARRRARARSGDRADVAGADAGRSDSADESTGDGPEDRAVGGDADLGALVGLAALALVAALVRKFGEERERDPLVDGPGGE